MDGVVMYGISELTRQNETSVCREAAEEALEEGLGCVWTSCWVRVCGPADRSKISMLWEWSGQVRTLCLGQLLLFFFCSPPPPAQGLVIRDA